jgi:hypothetical protein
MLFSESSDLSSCAALASHSFFGFAVVAAGFKPAILFAAPSGAS